MPKIIENLESKLVQEAKKQIGELGYSAVTIRSVAKGCGVGVGTVYNYFPSKEALLASYMLDDWRECISVIEQVSAGSSTPEAVLQAMYDQLNQFALRHQRVFRDETAGASFAGAFSTYHGLLRSQLAEPLRKYCSSDFAAAFIVEAMLTWTMAGKDFQDIYGMVAKLF